MTQVEQELATLLASRDPLLVLAAAQDRGPGVSVVRAVCLGRDQFGLDRGWPVERGDQVDRLAEEQRSVLVLRARPLLGLDEQRWLGAIAPVGIHDRDVRLAGLEQVQSLGGLG